MKRKEPPTKGGTAVKAKKPRPEVPEYHLAAQIRDGNGDAIWPAPADQMEAARTFIKDCASSGQKTLIVPDKDADGLTSGAIVFHTLTALGLDPDLITVYLNQKGSTIHSGDARAAMAQENPSYIIVLDQGSREAPPLIDAPHKGLVIDHHYAEAKDFPQGSSVVSACHSPPVATSSLLTYLLCSTLHPSIPEKCDWLCVIGTHGDLGNTIKWEHPFPDMAAVFKRYTKKAINEAVSQLNAPRRAASYNVRAAWDALINSSEPAQVLKNPKLEAARQEVNAEVERCTHTPPKFSPDGKVAVFRIKSEAQVHPVIATRWAGHLNSPKLDFILVANSGYLPGKVNFSCRVPRCARARDPPVDIIASLKAYAAAAPSGDLTQRLGADFAHGHVQASGGIVNEDEFEELMAVMKIGEKPPKASEGETTPKKKKEAATQKNTLANYFSKKSG